jgi:hypothetical protein
VATGGLFVKQRGIDFYNHVSRELVKEIIENPVWIYKIGPNDTTTNLYGEADEKRYYPPVQLYGLINNAPEETDTTEFGPDTKQNLIVAFNREQLRILNNFIPEVGDIIEWNSSYYEIGNVDESKFPGGHTDYNFSFVCYAHMTKKPAVLLDDFRVGEPRQVRQAP